MNMDLLQCEICEKTFKGRCDKTNLSKHLQQHGKEIDLFTEKCDTCDRIFTSKWELEVHKFKYGKDMNVMFAIKHLLAQYA